MLQRHIVRNAAKVAIVVGTILNIINQGGSMLEPASISWSHIALNYFVPYCVATYSAAKNELTRQVQ